MKINPSNHIREQRSDLTPYLFNFLKDNDAEKVMFKILTSEKLKSENNDFICFTDAPITSYYTNLDFFDKFKKKGGKAMFAKYGIGISRDWLVKNKTARPVIYGDNSERKMLPESFEWRFVELDVENYDFTWLREWRIPCKELDLQEVPKEHVIIIVETEEELKKFVVEYKFDIDILEFEKGEPGYFRESVKSTGKRKWKGFAFDQIRQCANDNCLSGRTSTQILGENIE